MGDYLAFSGLCFLSEGEGCQPAASRGGAPVRLSRLLGKCGPIMENMVSDTISIELLLLLVFF